MSAGALGLHHLRPLWEIVSQTPTDWPFVFFLPVLAAIFLASREKFRARAARFVKPAVLIGSVLMLLAAFRIMISYLSTNFIMNSFATQFASISWLFRLGHPVYSDSHALEPYSQPFGPYGYMIVGCFQQALGPSVFSSKLAPFLATLGSWIFLYLALRRRVAWLAALALTALAATLALPFDPMQFWPRPDPFLLLATSGGLWASTRRGAWGPVLLGLFIGFAINLKFYALALFLPAIAGAWRNHKAPGRWALAGLAAIGAALLPFAWPNISIHDYLLVLKMHADAARFMDGFALQCFGWGVVFFMIGLAPLFIHQGEAGETMAALRRNSDFVGALLLSFLLVSYPASNEGADAHHLIPLIPFVVYLAAHLYADLSSKPFLQRTPSRAGLSLVLSIVLVTGLDALFLAVRLPAALAPRETLAQKRIADIGRIFNGKMPCLLLNAAGSDAGREDDFYRAILVFNGMPIGIDPDAAMDYSYLRGYEPSLPALVSELQSQNRGPIVWICPKGADPFTMTSYYGSCSKVFSDPFVNDFHRLFQLSGQTACFDIYEMKSAD